MEIRQFRVVVRAKNFENTSRFYGESLAFPRLFVSWVFSGRGDSAYAHAGPQLRDAMKSAQGVNTMASNILGRFGAMDGTAAETSFDEGDLKVYIAVLKFPDAPEPGGFVVAWSPTTLVVERAAFTALSRLKARYPLAKLP